MRHADDMPPRVIDHDRCAVAVTLGERQLGYISDDTVGLRDQRAAIALLGARHTVAVYLPGGGEIGAAHAEGRGQQLVVGFHVGSIIPHHRAQV
jgi:hypothetical protein